MLLFNDCKYKIKKAESACLEERMWSMMND